MSAERGQTTTGGIRTARLEDANAIAAVHVSSWQTSYRGLMPDNLLDNLSVERRAAYWRSEIETGGPALIYVAEVGEEVVGFVSGGPYRPDPQQPDWDELYDAELYAIYLYEGKKRGGLGSRLFSTLVAGLLDRGYRSMMLWVLKENPPARSFYEKMGGRVVGEKSEDFAGAEMVETAYGWEDLARP